MLHVRTACTPCRLCDPSHANSGLPDTPLRAWPVDASYLTGDGKVREAALELADCIAWRWRTDEFPMRLLPARRMQWPGLRFWQGLYDGNARRRQSRLAIVVAAYRAKLRGGSSPRRRRGALGCAPRPTLHRRPYRRRRSDHAWCSTSTCGRWQVSGCARRSGPGDPYDARGRIWRLPIGCAIYAWLDLAPPKRPPRGLPYECSLTGAPVARSRTTTATLRNNGYCGA
jgi:hypothetical protein